MSDMIIRDENDIYQAMLEKMLSIKIVLRTPIERNGMSGMAVFKDALLVIKSTSA